MGELTELVFTNSDARPKVTTVRLDQDSIAQVMAWYGAYFAGDRYTVHADGVKLAKDHNGELVGALPDQSGLYQQRRGEANTDDIKESRGNG